MAIMLAKTCAAFKAAGAPEGDAAAATEELANYENRLASIDWTGTSQHWKRAFQLCGITQFAPMLAPFRC